MADRISKESRSKNMQAVRSKNTVMENKVSAELWRRGYRFRRNVMSLEGKPDIAIKKYRVAIFLDSCFWHGCSIHGEIPKTNVEFWAEKIGKNKQRDSDVDKYYQNLGWNTLRIWEHDIKKDLNSVIKEISEFIDTAKARGK